jgi:hypothetical protein
MVALYVNSRIICGFFLSWLGGPPQSFEHSIWDCVGFYMIHTFLDPSVESQFRIISKSCNFLFGTTTTPSLIVTSSQVRVGTPLPLLLCCISGLGPEGLWRNRRIPLVSPGTSWGDPCVFLGKTLPPRTFHAKLNGQSAVSTRRPSTSQHPLEKQVTSLHTYKNQIFFWFTSNAFLKRPVLLKYWLLRPFSMRKLHAKAGPSKDYFTHMRTLIVAQRYDIPWDWLWDACHMAGVRWGSRCKGFRSKEGPHYHFEWSARNPTINLIHEFGNPLGIPYPSRTM